MIKCLLTAVFVVILSSQSPWAETVEEKIARLERQLNLLSQQVYAGGGAAPSGPSESPAGLNQSIGLEQQQQQLLSRVEELAHEVNILGQKVDDLAGFAGNKEAGRDGKPLAEQAPVQDPPHKPAPHHKAPVAAEAMDVSVPRPQEAKPKHSQAQTGLPQTSLPEGSVQEQYDRAIGFLKANDFAAARKAFQLFLRLHGDHDLAANATYWLGETFYAEQKYDKAILIFAQGYKAFSKGTKGPDMLLKIALCLEKQKEIKNACITLDQLHQSHKGIPQGTLQAADKLKKRLKCVANS